MMNFYQILNVKQTASKSEIKSAYKSLIKKYHPDIYKGDKAFAERKTKEINEAFDTLSDPAKKAEYDATLTPKASYSDFNSTYNTANRYNPYSKQTYSEPSKYSPYSNRKKQSQTNNYQRDSKGTSSVSYTERVIFSKDDFLFFKNSLKDKKSAVIVVTGLIAILIVLIFVFSTTTSQLSSFYNSSNYLDKKITFKEATLEKCTNTHSRSVYSNPDVEYYVRLGDSVSVVEQYLGKPDSTIYNYDYLFYYYGNSFIMFELNFDYEVLGFYDKGELVSYLD